MTPIIKHFPARLRIDRPEFTYMDAEREREAQLARERIRWLWHFGIGVLVGAIAFATMELLTH